MWVVYIVECADRSLYTGITNDLQQRMAAHQAGKGAKYTRHRGPLILRYTETWDSKSAALRREAAIKSFDRATKLMLIAAGDAQATDSVPRSKADH